MKPPSPRRLLPLAALLPALLAARAAADPAPDGVPPIVWAAYNDDAAGVRTQLDAGVSPDAAVTREDALPPPCVDADLHGRENRGTALLWAAAKGDAALVKLLLERRATLDLRDAQGWAAIHAAACNGHAEAVAALLAAAPDPKAEAGLATGRDANRYETHNFHEQHYRKTALHLAARGDSARFDDFSKVALALLGAGADPDAADDEGNTPLHYAAAKCNARFADLLINGPRPAAAEARNNNGVQPFWSAKQNGCEAALKPAFYPSAQSLAGSLKKDIGAARWQQATKDWEARDSAAAGEAAAGAGALGTAGKAAAAGTSAGAGGTAASALPGATLPGARGPDGAAPPPPPGSQPSVAGVGVEQLEAAAASAQLPEGDRLTALRLLSLRHDPALIPFFAKLVSDPVTADAAATALSSALESLNASKKGGDWSAFNARAAEAVGPLGRMPETSEGNALYRSLLKDSFMLMDDAAKKDFVKNMSEVDLLLMLGYNFGDQQVNQNNGMHSDAARVVWEALQARLKQSGRPLASVLDSPEVTALPQTRVRVLTQLYKYDFMKDALPDASLAQTMPARLFPAAYKNGSMGTFEAYGIGDAIMSDKTEAAGFARTLLQGVRSGTVDPMKGLLFLEFHKDRLAPPEAKDLADLWSASKFVQPWLRDRYEKNEADARSTPAVYAGWPAGKLNVLLVMTQADKAEEFITGSLHGRAPGPPDASGVRHASIDTRFGSGKPVHIDLQIFPSNKEGWAVPASADPHGPTVTTALVQGLNAPEYQAVFYRGHVGDYETSTVRSEAKPQYKAFGDLGCYSDINSERAVASCKSCAYFGTTVVSQAERTNGFLPLLLDELAKRDTYAGMYARFAKDAPKTHDKFTGSYDPADRFAADLAR